MFKIFPPFLFSFIIFLINSYFLPPPLAMGNRSDQFEGFTDQDSDHGEAMEAFLRGQRQMRARQERDSQRGRSPQRHLRTPTPSPEDRNQTRGRTRRYHTRSRSPVRQNNGHRRRTRSRSSHRRDDGRDLRAVNRGVTPINNTRQNDRSRPTRSSTRDHSPRRRARTPSSPPPQNRNVRRRTRSPHYQPRAPTWSPPPRPAPQYNFNPHVNPTVPPFSPQPTIVYNNFVRDPVKQFDPRNSSGLRRNEEVEEFLSQIELSIPIEERVKSAYIHMTYQSREEIKRKLMPEDVDWGRFKDAFRSKYRQIVSENERRETWRCAKWDLTKGEEYAAAKERLERLHYELFGEIAEPIKVHEIRCKLIEDFHLDSKIALGQYTSSQLYSDGDFWHRVDHALQSAKRASSRGVLAIRNDNTPPIVVDLSPDDKEKIRRLEEENRRLKAEIARPESPRPPNPRREEKPRNSPRPEYCSWCEMRGHTVKKCKKAPLGCWACKATDHIKRNCPKKNEQKDA